MPVLRPFRALRYDLAAVGDASAIVCPPYDVISTRERDRLLTRPYNAVRLELPVAAGMAVPSGEGGPDDPYLGAASTLRAWRAAGVLRPEARPSLYVYEQTFRLADGAERRQRGFFARLRLEPFGTGVRPHERTMAAPKADRLRLLRATHAFTSAIVVLPMRQGPVMGGAVAAVAARAPDVEATDDAGVRHRLWVVPGDTVEARRLLAAAAGPLAIADGHHRYETALRYRDEVRQGIGTGDRGPGTAGEEIPADHVLALVLDPGPAGDGPLILPTHRVVQGHPTVANRLDAVVARAGSSTSATTDEVVAAFSPPFASGPGRLALILPGTARLLHRRADAEAWLLDPATPAVVRRLDVALVEAMLAAAGASAVSYTHAADEAARAVAAGTAVAALLVAPPPLEAILAVAAAGELMPQKSTYFYPKAATGLVIDAFE